MRISKGDFTANNMREACILKAYYFAENAHEGVDQLRKYTNDPYINHPVEVMEILSDIGINNFGILQAALLHDVVEDTNISIHAITDSFGSYVSAMVSDLTDVPNPLDGNRAYRKAIDRNHISQGMPSSKTIKLADMISNSRSIVKNDPKFARVYLPEKRLLLGVLKEGDKRLWDECDKILREHGY